jgi:hypothetical protein
LTNVGYGNDKHLCAIWHKSDWLPWIRERKKPKIVRATTTSCDSELDFQDVGVEIGRNSGCDRIGKINALMQKCQQRAQPLTP